MCAKMGRPTDKPKKTRISVRLDEESATILKKYCERYHLDNGEATRQAIRMLEGKLMDETPLTEEFFAALDENYFEEFMGLRKIIMMKEILEKNAQDQDKDEVKKEWLKKMEDALLADDFDRAKYLLFDKNTPEHVIERFALQAAISKTTKDTQKNAANASTPV